jgi:hypothetical protein
LAFLLLFSSSFFFPLSLFQLLYFPVASFPFFLIKFLF